MERPRPEEPSEEPPSQTAASTISSARVVAVQIGSAQLAQVVREHVQADFEQAHGIRLSVEVGNPATGLERLREQRQAPRYLVVGLEDSGVALARDEQLIAPLEAHAIPNLADVYPECLLGDGYGVGQGVCRATAWYNSERLGPAPATYQTFWDAQLKERVAVPSIRTLLGIQWLVAAAAVADGRPLAEAQYHADAGFEGWRRLKPNLHSTFHAFKQVAPLLAQGEVWLAFGPGNLATSYILKGAPIERADVIEGAFLITNALVLVRHPTWEPLGRDLINRILEPAVQASAATATLTGPVNRRAAVSPELATLLPIGEVERGQLLALDWHHVNAHRAAWTERWNRELSD